MAWMKATSISGKKFIDEIIDTERLQLLDALAVFCHFAIEEKRKIPCVVLDNIDHLNSVKDALHWAAAVWKRAYTLTTVALDSGTQTRLKPERQDDLGDHAQESFWLRRPKARKVIDQRIEYLAEILKGTSTRPQGARTSIGRRDQYVWRIDDTRWLVASHKSKSCEMRL